MVEAGSAVGGKKVAQLKQGLELLIGRGTFGERSGKAMTADVDDMETLLSIAKLLDLSVRPEVVLSSGGYISTVLGVLYGGTYGKFPNYRLYY